MEVHNHLKANTIFVYQDKHPLLGARSTSATLVENTHVRELFIDKVVIDTRTLHAQGKIPLFCCLSLRVNGRIFDGSIQRVYLNSQDAGGVGIPLPLNNEERTVLVFPAPWEIFAYNTPITAQNFQVDLVHEGRPFPCDSFAIWLHYE